MTAMARKTTPLPVPASPAEARNIVCAAFPNLRIVSIRHFEDGWANTVWIVNEESGPLLFRFPKTLRVSVSTSMEMGLLRELSPVVPTPVPDYRYTAPQGVPGFPHPFGGYTMLPGRPLTGIEKIATPMLAAAAGRFVSALQTFPTELAASLGVPGGSAEDWRREHDAWYRAARPIVTAHLEPDEVAAVDRILMEFLNDERHFRFRPVLSHRDLGPDHLLVNPSSGSLTGVIDFEDAAIGDPAFDFTGLVQVLPEVLDYYDGQADETFMDRIRFYRFVMPIHEIEYGFEIGDPEHIVQGCADLRANLRAVAT